MGKRLFFCPRSEPFIVLSIPTALMKLSMVSTFHWKKGVRS